MLTLTLLNVRIGGLWRIFRPSEQNIALIFRRFTLDSHTDKNQCGSFSERDNIQQLLKIKPPLSVSYYRRTYGKCVQNAKKACALNILRNSCGCILPRTDGSTRRSCNVKQGGAGARFGLSFKICRMKTVGRGWNIVPLKKTNLPSLFS